MTETIDHPSSSDLNPKLGGIKALAVFTYVGKVLLLLASVGILVGLFVSEDMIVNKIKDADTSSDQWVLSTKILCIVYIFSSIGAWIGVNKMKKGKRLGFFIHAGSNLLLMGFLVMNANIVEYILAASLGFFILMYAMFLGKLGK